MLPTMSFAILILGPWFCAYRMRVAGTVRRCCHVCTTQGFKHSNDFFFLLVFPLQFLWLLYLFVFLATTAQEL